MKLPVYLRDFPLSSTAKYYADMELLSHINACSPDPLHQEVVYKRPLAYIKMENLIKEMQDPEHGVPVRSQKLFLTSIPAAFAGYDIIEWLMERLSIEDSIEAIHLASLLCQHGYFFPISSDNRNLSVKDDSSLYRFQTPYYWPSQVPCLDSVDYAIFLSKRTLRNKQKHGLDDYELDSLNQLKKNLTQKWDFISMQADEQVRISKDRKKVDKMVTDSQERAFWRVLRPPPGITSCVETPPMHMADFHAKEGAKQLRRTNLIEDLRAEVDLLRSSCIRTRIKVSQALESSNTHCELYNEQDPFLVPRQPSNPWQSDDPCYWIINAPLVEVPMERRVKRWAISMKDLVFDSTGLREFTTYLKKEYCHENIRFWTAVRGLRSGPASRVKSQAQHIYNEFLSPGAPCEINIDMRTMEKVQKEMKLPTPSRFTFDPAAEHVYTLLLKKDCYPRFIRSDHYKSLLSNAMQPSTKKRFFSFMQPGKKKSSTTSAPIFPISSQSATAGVGEVLKVTDEVLLLTTGNRPDHLSASNPDVEKMSSLSECPYRGDMIPDEKRDNGSLSKQTLSGGSFDDVCPWESLEKIPEKEKPEVKAGPPPKLSTSAPSTATTKVSLLSSSAPACALAAIISAPIRIPPEQIPKKSKEEEQIVSSPPAIAAPVPTQVPPQKVLTSIPSSSPPPIEGSSVDPVISPAVSSSRLGDKKGGSLSKQTSAGSSNSGSYYLEGKSEEEAPPTKPEGQITQEIKSEPVRKIISVVSKDGHKEKLVEICPWDHENGTQPEMTTFVKTYSTLGYL